MRLWQHTAIAFRRSLQRAAGAGAVPISYFEFQDGAVKLLDEGNRSIPIRSVLTSRPDNCLFILSDAMGFGWQTGQIPQILNDWAKHHPVVVMQPLPVELWNRTSFKKARFVDIRCTEQRRPLVATLSTNDLRSVAELLSHRAVSETRVRGISNSPVDFKTLTPDKAARTVSTAPSDIQLSTIYLEFKRNGNPLTFRLALYLASLPMTLPLMRLAQASFAPEAASWHLADLFMTGLVRRKGGNQGIAREPSNLKELEAVEYEFWPVVGAMLRADAGIDRFFDAQRLVSRYVHSRTGRGNEFMAYVFSSDPDTSKAERWGDDIESFANVSRKLLREMGVQPRPATLMVAGGDPDIPSTSKQKPVDEKPKSQKRRIFVSCESADFQDSAGEFPGLRENLLFFLRRADWEVKSEQIGFYSPGHNILQHLEMYIRNCDAIIHLIGGKNGVAPDADEVDRFINDRPDFLKKHPRLLKSLEDFSGITYVQWESLIAINHGIPLFSFVSKVAVSGQRKHLNRLEYSKRDTFIFADENELISELLSISRITTLSKPSDSKRIADSRILAFAPRRFDGREESLTELDRAWASPNRVPVYILVGPGGTGKTSLVAHWLSVRLAKKGWPWVERYFDWSFYDQGKPDGCVDADLFFHSALRFFGELSEAIQSPVQRAEELVRLVRQHRSLIVLEGLERIQHSVDSESPGRLMDPAMDHFLKGLFQNNPGLCIVTSRVEIPDLPSTVIGPRRVSIVPAGGSKNQTVYFSANSREFSVYREELAKHLLRPRIKFWAQEDFTRTASSTLETIDSAIQQCDIVGHLIGRTFGAMPTHDDVKALLQKYTDFNERVPFADHVDSDTSNVFSYTQWEAYLALYHERPLFVYSCSDIERQLQSSGQSDSPIDSDLVRQLAHRVRLASLGCQFSEFSDVEEFIAAAMNNTVSGPVNVVSGNSPSERANETANDLMNELKENASEQTQRHLKQLSDAQTFAEAEIAFSQTLKAGQRSTTQLFNILLSKSATSQEAQSVFQRMLAESVPPSTFTFSILMTKAPSLDEGQSLLQQMLHAQLKPSEDIFNKLLSKASTLTEGRLVFKQMLDAAVEPGVFAYTTLLSKTETLADARSIFQEMLQQSVKPNRVTFNALLSKASTADEIQAVLRQMSDAQWDANDVTFNTLISKTATLEEGNNILNEMLKANVTPNEITFTTLLSKATTLNEGKDILGKMRSAGVHPNAVTFDTMMSKATTEAERQFVIREMRNAGYDVQLANRGSERPHIVWIDDDKFFGSHIEAELSSEFEVTILNTVESALQYFSKGERCDVAIVDVMMPAPVGEKVSTQDGFLAGVWLLNKVQARIVEDHIPVILYSNVAKDVEPRVNIPAEFLTVCNKFETSPRKLKEIVSSLIRKSRQKVPRGWQPREFRQVHGKWLESLGENDILQLAYSIVEKGISAGLAGYSYLSAGGHSFLDPIQIRAASSLHQSIRKYAAMQSSTKPLSLAVFGMPGSFKCWTIRQIIESSSTIQPRFFEFNLSQFDSQVQLHSAFLSLSVTPENELGVAIFDEFDSTRNGERLGWLKSFLSAMQDGVFVSDLDKIIVRRCLLVFVSHHFSFNEFCNIDVQGAKLQDFNSRLTGYLELSDLNATDKSGTSVTLQRAIAFRQQFEREKALAASDQLDIDHQLLRDLLQSKSYQYGVRSIASIVKSLSKNTDGRITHKDLPSASMLQLHLHSEAPAADKAAADIVSDDSAGHQTLRNEVYISYSREDIKAAEQLVQALKALGVSVFLDRHSLQAGNNFEQQSQEVIHQSTLVFVSLISRSTETNPNSFIHKERAWAAQEHADGSLFYVPLLLDDISDSILSLEPSLVAAVHRERFNPDSCTRIAMQIREQIKEARES
jgi:CheY-like chemotaxis protein